MENLKDFEQNAVNRIKKGARFNGKFYTYPDGKSWIFAGNVKYQIINKEAFLEAIGRKETKKMDYAEAYRVGGLDYAEEGNY